MTRVALCLSGQPRKAIENFTAIYKNIIAPNDADVFIHMNYDSNNNYIIKSHIDKGVCTYEDNISAKIIELYNPKRYLIESPKHFKNPNVNLPESQLDAHYEMNKSKQLSRSQIKEHVVSNLHSMFYSIFKANELKQVYANENGFTYDYVIRLRFDACPSTPLQCELYNPNYIYYEEMGQIDDLISDWFNFGNNAIMNVYSSIYLQLEYLGTFLFYPKDSRPKTTLYPSDYFGGVFEYSIRDIMNLFNIPKKGISLGISLLY